jgi:ABC-type transport system involved in multi-copper enzyme maturation permease subunit
LSPAERDNSTRDTSADPDAPPAPTPADSNLESPVETAAPAPESAPAPAPAVSPNDTEPESGSSSPPNHRARKSRLWLILRVVMFPYLFLLFCKRAIANPIVAKELRVGSRRKRTYALRAGYLLVLLAIMLIVWYFAVLSAESYYYNDDYGEVSVALRMQSERIAGQALTQTMAWIQFGALALLAPVLTGASISDELEGRTFGIILTTPLTVSQIVIGKLVSRLALVLFIVLLSAPILLALRVYGGYDLGQLIRLDVLCLTTAFAGASMGILLSAWEKTAWRAVFLAYFWLFVLWILVPVFFTALLAYLATLQPDGFFSSLAADDGDRMIWIISHLSPVVTMSVMSAETLGAGIMFGPIISAWIVTNVFNVLIGVIAIMLTTKIGRRLARENSTATTPGLRFIKSLFRRIGRAIPRIRRATSSPLSESAGDPNATRLATADDRTEASKPDKGSIAEVSDYPVFWREGRLPSFGSRIHQNVAYIAIGLLLIWFYVSAQPWMDWLNHVLLVMVAISVQLIIVGFGSTNVFTQEKQAQSWDALLCTPLSPRSLVFQKYFATLRRCCLPTLMLSAHLLFFGFVTTLPLFYAIHVIAITVCFTSFLAATGLFFSMFARRNATAMALNLLLAFGLWGAFPLLAGILTGFMQDVPGLDAFDPLEVLFAGFWINPFYWLSIAWQPVIDSIPISATYADYDMGYGWTSYSRLNIWQFTGALAASCAFMLAIAFGLLFFVTWRFNRITGRSS